MSETPTSSEPRRLAEPLQPTETTWMMEYSKYDGSRHWHFPVQHLGSDEHGTWFGGSPGIQLQKNEEPPITEVDGFVMLVPSAGEWIAFWNRSDEAAVYVDITDTPRLELGTISAVDLDLDVIVWQDGRVEVVDRDEFDQHRREMGYPAEVVAAAEAAAVWVEAAMRAGQAPFDRTAEPWLERAAADWGDAEPAERRPALGALAVVIHEERVLLARHTYGPPVWALLGGVVAVGERIDSAARRELLEEAGLAVEVGRLLAHADLGDLSLFVLEARPLGPIAELRPRAGEIEELAWWGRDELTARSDIYELARVLALSALSEASAPALERIDLTWPGGETIPVYLGGPATVPLIEHPD